MRAYLLNTLFLLTISTNCFCQTGNKNNKFTISGKLLNRDTGKVVLFYFDLENKYHHDTAIIKKDRFVFSGTVNRVCEALLWTNLKNMNFDDRSVIRFLLVPKKISINFQESREPAAIILGSNLQKEKEAWDSKKSALLTAKADLHKNSDTFYRQAKITNPPDFANTVKYLTFQRDSIIEKIRIKDIGYIKAHTDSYLSSYLLLNHYRKLPIDTLQMLYVMLGSEVKKSTIGKSLLDVIYPLTNDEDFRRLNPVVDLDFDKRLKKIHSIYDFSLNDTAGNKIDLGALKWKYLILDFWASWCHPCIENIPTQKQMMKDYNVDSIQFISISLDTDIDKWKRAVKQHGLTGLQLSEPDGFSGLIAVYFKVLYVPHYILVDKTGHIINAHAPQPLDPELKIILDKLLNKHN